MGVDSSRTPRTHNPLARLLRLAWFLCFPFGLLRASKTLVAQAIGAGRSNDARAHRTAAVVAGLAMGGLALILGEVAALFIGAFADDAASAAVARSYLHARMLGAPFAIVFVAVRETAYGEGNVRAPMVIPARHYHRG